MIESFFNIRYVFGKQNVWDAIDKVVDEGGKGFVVVADGVVVNTAQRSIEYHECLKKSLFATCDSGWIPVYIKKIYGPSILVNGKAFETTDHYVQYCGPQIFPDFIKRRRYRMFFMGTDQRTLDGLKATMLKENPDLEGMTFYELPFLSVSQFDYEGIARIVEEDGADIIWVALGAPKQCFFMQRLLPHLKKGVMLGVGAAFKFYSGTAEKRCPEWVHDIHLEFAYRIMQDPKKQIERCWWILRTLPIMIKDELSKKRRTDDEIKVMSKYVEVINELTSHDKRSKENERIQEASQKVLEIVSGYDEGECRNRVNLYWLQMFDCVLDALKLTRDKNAADNQLEKILSQYSKTLVGFLDKDSLECASLIGKAESLGIL